MRLWAAASSLAPTLGMPSMTPASISAWRFHRHSVAWQMLVSAATTATGSPDRSRKTICRCTVAGYIRGM